MCCYHHVCRKTLLLFLLPLVLVLLHLLLLQHLLLPMQVLQHLVRVAVAFAAAIVVCDVIIAHGTADANGMRCMRLYSVSVAVACAAALLV